MGNNGIILCSGQVVRTYDMSVIFKSNQIPVQLNANIIDRGLSSYGFTQGKDKNLCKTYLSIFQSKKNYYSHLLKKIANH